MVNLACIQHASQGTLLSIRNVELVVALDVDPALGVCAVERLQRRLPFVRALIALGAVGSAGDGPELRAGDVVGESLALGSSPFRSTRL